MRRGLITSRAAWSPARETGAARFLFEPGRLNKKMKPETKKQKVGKADARALPAPREDRAIPSPRAEYRPRRTRLVVTQRARIALAFLLFAFSSARADTFTVWGRIQDIGGGSLPTRLTWTPTNIVVVGNAGLIGGPPITITATNGYFTNVFECGDYWVRLGLANGITIPRAAFLVVVPCGGGTNHITNLIANAASYVFTNAWGGGGGTGEITNNSGRVGVVVQRGVGTNLGDLTLVNPRLTGDVAFDLLTFDSSTERGWVQEQADGRLQVSQDGNSLSNLNASALASGSVPAARLGSGTANSSSYLRGDQVWSSLLIRPYGTSPQVGIYDASGTGPWLLVHDIAVVTAPGISFAGNGGLLTNIPDSGIAVSGDVSWMSSAGDMFDIGVSGGAFLRINNQDNQFEFFNAEMVGDAIGLTNLNASSLSSGTVSPARLATNAAAANKILSATSAATAQWTDIAGGGGTNSGPITLSYSGLHNTNVAISCVTPAGCVTNAPLYYRLTCSTNFWINAPTGMLDGQQITIEFLQDATGSRILNGLDSEFVFGTDITALSLTTTAAKRDFATFRYNGVTGKWYPLGFVRGY